MLTMVDEATAWPEIPAQQVKMHLISVGCLINIACVATLAQSRPSMTMGKNLQDLNIKRCVPAKESPQNVQWLITLVAIWQPKRCT